jgi:hypothetical protein
MEIPDPKPWNVSVMPTSYWRRCCAIILLFAATFALVTGVRADERQDKVAASVDTPDAVKHGELVFHGNYCGVGNRAGTEPIYALDMACMHHDACTPTGKAQSCACNARLAEEAGAVARDPTQTAELQSLATLTATAAAAGMVLCVPAVLTAGVASAPPNPAGASDSAAEAPAGAGLAPPLELVAPAAAVPTAP